MKLSSDQAEAVKSWVSEGAGVSQVQKKLESEFGISMTYMDVRFLLDDIDVQLKEPVRDVAPEDALTAPLPGRDSEENAENGGASAGAGAGEGEVVVTKSPIQRPGAVVGGEITFSDGGKAEWVLDQSGQLGLIPAVQGYNPPQKDMPAVQNKIREILGMEAAPDSSAEDADDGVSSNVEVTVSPIQRPDSLAFGEVTFSDGQKAEWRLDREGQLALISETKGYKPSHGDTVAFQKKLQKLLSEMY